MINMILKGGFFIWPILVCSIFSLTVILERIFYFYKTKMKKKNLLNTIQTLLINKNNTKALNICKKENSFLGHFLYTGIKIKEYSEEEKKKILSHIGSKKLEESEKNLQILAVIGNISTLLGLLGTVTGMIQTFIKIESTNGITNVSILAGGIWEALLTTAAGLSIAIPSLVMYHYFESIVENRSIQFKNIASDIFNIH